MRGRFLLLAVLTWGCASAAPASQASSPALTVVSYNIHAGKDPAGQPNLERVAATLDSLDADVVLLQEVDRGTRRSGRVDQIAELARLTGMHAVFGKSLDYDGGEYGIALLSRLPVRANEVIDLIVDPPEQRAGGTYEPRVALYALLESRAGPLAVINTHLGAGAPVYRRQEVLVLLAHVGRLAGRTGPLVIGGDLNARPETPEIAAATLIADDAWFACGSGGGETFPAHAPDRRIDFVLLRDLDCTRARVHATMISDHRPLVVEISTRRSGR